MSECRAEAAVHPLLGMSRGLDELDERLVFHPGTPPTGDWVTLAGLADHALIGSLLDRSPANGMRLRNVAAAQLGASLACALVRPLMAMLHVYETVPALRPDTTHLRSEAHRFEGLAVAPGPLLGTTAEHPAVRQVGDTDELLVHTANLLVTLLGPVLRAVRAEGRFGLGQLWGSVLDMIGATSLLVARTADLDQSRVWTRAQRICDLVAEIVDNPRLRYPQPFSVPWRDDNALFTVKGTCCLQYREYGLRAGQPDDGSGAYCKTCPFIAEESRVQRCASQLERDLRR